MNVISMLRKLGDRLGIIEVSKEASTSTAPVKIQTRAITLSELTMTIQVTNVRSLAESPAELLISFSDVFKAAGITTPPGGWSIDRLREFLSTDSLRKLDRAETQQEIARTLAAENIDPANIVRDAISRDQALDAFADSVMKKRQRWVEERKHQIRNIEQEIVDEEKKWKDWRQKKRQWEQEMSGAVQYLIDKPVISVDEE
jgi:hypothetical protein